MADSTNSEKIEDEVKEFGTFRSPDSSKGEFQKELENINIKVKETKSSLSLQIKSASQSKDVISQIVKEYSGVNFCTKYVGH